jgi:hypothetical protein
MHGTTAKNHETRTLQVQYTFFKSHLVFEVKGIFMPCRLISCTAGLIGVCSGDEMPRMFTVR